jgi:rod shape-determining protein MreD
MSNTIILRNIVRAIFLLAFQVLVLSQINLGGKSFSYISIFIYPLFLMFLPLVTPVWLMMVIGFVYGYIIDIFLNTIGMHTATCVFMGFIRSGLIRFFEPQGGYKEKSSPTRRSMGFVWFLRYASVFMFLHIFFFFSVEEFTPFYWRKIIFYSIPSYAISMVLVMIYSFLLDPTE